jgi:hypothetical protein
MSEALLNRIKFEEEAKTKQCAVIRCTNQATHTWSGWPTCDDCGSPSRKKLPFPVIIKKPVDTNDNTNT